MVAFKDPPTDFQQPDVVREYVHQAKRLGLEDANKNPETFLEEDALEAKFVTAQDAVIETADGQRLPTVPVHEARRLNELKDKAEGRDPSDRTEPKPEIRLAKDGTVHGLDRTSLAQPPNIPDEILGENPHSSLKTNPLFPDLPVYGSPSFRSSLQYLFLRFCAAVLSFCFLITIILGAVFTSVPATLKNTLLRLRGGNPAEKRPFFKLEMDMEKTRNERARAWINRDFDSSSENLITNQSGHDDNSQYVPSEGGPDQLVADIKYYARRVGLDAEEFKVQTEDGFIIRLWHVYNPKEFTPTASPHRKAKSAELQPDSLASDNHADVPGSQFRNGNKRYPVLMMHGLLQSAGAFCCTDDNSLAFYLAKSGYDVWLGNNRCGAKPEHVLLEYKDPRMWAWNIRQMGVIDLPALITRVLHETGFDKLGLVCHSQGTTETFVALAKEQRPDIGEKISVFCALAPAVYAGPLIHKAYFKFMRLISPDMFRLIFGIHSFIPFMLQMHDLLPGRVYGLMGYLVFCFLFNWTDERWDRGLRDRLFQFSPVYVSSESMRWWLGRECFAKQKCILATKDEAQIEDEEDEEQDEKRTRELDMDNTHRDNEKYSWFDKRAPPFAFWIAGSDQLVDGKRLLRRFERGREPFVDLVHAKVIDDYEHLDVIWAINVIDMVGREVKEVIWKTVPEATRAKCRTPADCGDVEIWSGSQHPGTAITSVSTAAAD